VQLYQTQGFLIVLGIIYFVIAAVQNERRYALDALRNQLTALEAALARIRDDDNNKTEFLAILAHELRNPLSPIVSALELLKLKGMAATESNSLILMISGRIATMDRLLDDLLDVSRISHKKLRLQLEPISLRDMVERSVQAVDEFVVRRTHTYRLELTKEPLIVEADSIRIEQVFVNLFKNAVKYSEPGTAVTISLTREGNAGVVRVRDQGIGIEPRMRDRIFEPFVQGRALHTRRTGTGLGIGLSLTKMLVEMHSGTIQVKSEGVGKGSEFIVHLPLKRELPLVVPGREESRKGKKDFHKVLVVDDNVPAAEGIGKLLRHKGHATDVAFTGIEAISKSKAFKPDVILLDIGLPDMDGYEVARILRAADGFSGTLVALTGYGMEDDKNRAYQAGFDHHLTKPVSIVDVEAVL
jgi:two-component system CheB/CheR fusion protein